MSFTLDFSQGAEEQYLDLLRNILAHGSFKGDRTGTGTQDLFGYQLRIDLQKGFPLLTTKKMFHRGMVEELLWMLRGHTHVKPLQEKGVHIWDEWATPEQSARFGHATGDLGPIYGHQWRSFGATLAGPGNEGRAYENDGWDQIAEALRLLRNNPYSRRIIVTGWNPTEVDFVALPPCHTLFQFSVRKDEDKLFLDCQLYQRSADVFLGVPFNIASYALLTHIMAGLTGMTPGTFIHTFGSVHIYNNHREQVAEQLSRKPFNLPKLKIHTFELPNAEDLSYVSENPTTWTIDDFLSYCGGAEDFEFTGYESHPAIKAQVSV